MWDCRVASGSITDYLYTQYEHVHVHVHVPATNQGRPGY